MPRRRRVSTARQTNTIVRRPGMDEGLSVKLKDFVTVNIAGTGIIYTTTLIEPFNILDGLGAGGQQPYMRDHYFGLYERAMIFGCKITAQFNVLAATVGTCVYVGLVTDPANDITAISFPNNPTQLTGVKYKCVRRRLTTDAGHATVSMYVTWASMLGVKDRDALLQSNSYYNTATAAPSNTPFVLPFIFDPKGGAVDTDVMINVKYYCHFYRRKTQTDD